MDNAVSGVAWTDEGLRRDHSRRSWRRTPSRKARATAYLELLSRDAANAPVPSLCEELPVGRRSADANLCFRVAPASRRGVRLLNHSRRWRPNDILLGITTGGTAVATLPATLKTLYEQIEDWRLQSIRLNCFWGTGRMTLRHG